MNILLLGGAGFVAKEIVSALENYNHVNIYKLVRRREDADHGSLYFTLEEVSLPSVKKRLLRVDFDWIINLAGKKAPIQNERSDELNLFDLNCSYPYEIIQTFSSERTKLISMSTYVQCHPKIEEFPRNSYPIAKLRLSEKLKLYSQISNNQFLDLRLFTLFGRNDKKNNLIPSLLECAIHGTPFYATKGEQLISLTPVEDLIEFLVPQIIESKLNYSGVVNFWNPKYSNLRNLIEHINSIWNAQIEIIWGEKKYSGYEMFEEWPFDGMFLADYIWKNLDECLLQIYQAKIL
jgi:nucleoside-diphosphate-sugar epimerase